MNEFYSEREVVARKPRRCCEAGRGCVRTAEIEPGQRYVRCAGKDDGGFFSFASCLRCARLRNRAYQLVVDFGWDEGIEFGRLLEALREALS